MDTAGERRELAGTSRGIQEHPKALTQKHHKATAIARKLGMIIISIPDAGEKEIKDGRAPSNTVGASLCSLADPELPGLFLLL